MRVILAAHGVRRGKMKGISRFAQHASPKLAGFCFSHGMQEVNSRLLRGKKQQRRPGEAHACAAALKADGAVEVEACRPRGGVGELAVAPCVLHYPRVVPPGR